MPSNKSKAEISKEYDERQHGNKPPKKGPKTGSERAREYRARKKALLQAAKVRASTESSDIPTVEVQGLPEPMVILPAHHLSDSTNAILPYSDFEAHKNVREIFLDKFENNSFGHVCDICSRLWFKDDLKIVRENNYELLKKEFPLIDVTKFKACQCCFSALNRNKIPTYSTSNGFKYPDKPAHLPELDLISERLVSTRIPFRQIRRLRHMCDQHGILGQVINVPVDVNLMVTELPRDVSDDYCINVHIKRKQIHKSSYLTGFVNKRSLKVWLRYLCDTPLYKLYKIKINERFFDDTANEEILIDEISEDIQNGDCLIAQQQTLMWNEEKYLIIAPGEQNVLQSLLFDEHAEELSFPAIYLGQFRTFKDEMRVTPFMMATSEIRRVDRRGVTPHHLLYVAMKIMRQRIRDTLSVAFKHMGNYVKMTKQQIESEKYINQSIETNLAFLKSIPNSAYYWAGIKKDLFAMIRQYGKPTMFLTLSANEIGWVQLLKVLYKLKNNGNEISDEALQQMSYIQKCSLVNEDAVTCAIQFHKIVNVIMDLLTSKKTSPFEEYRVIHYFKRIEFQHHGSPQAHILLWIQNAPADPLQVNRGDAIAMIDKLISVSSTEASGAINLQTHKHNFACFKQGVSNRPQKCRFEAPFMPCKNTTILIPMKNTENNYRKHREQYGRIRENLENQNYLDMDAFYKQNNISSDEHYANILRAGITRPRVFLKRQPSEKWHNAFNPFILNVLQSNMDIQFILGEYSCDAYVIEYANKKNRGISNLQRQLLKVINEKPDFDFVDVTKKMGVELLNGVEITSQEAAWFLLCEPMSKSSSVIVFIPTMWPAERQRVREAREEMEKMGLEDESTDIWKENYWFEKYEKRPKSLEACTLTQYVANYSVSGEKYTKLQEPRVVRYRNYDMVSDLNEYKREMVTLHIPFRNEEREFLSEFKFVKIYDNNEDLIFRRRKEFEPNLNIQQTIEIRKELWQE